MKKNKPLLYLICLMSITFIFTFFSLSDTLWANTEKELAKIEETRKENAKCLRCHGAEGLKTTKGGKTISLYVDEGAFLESIHESISCQTCHVGMTDYPHRQDTIAGKSFKESINKQCQSCHKDVYETYQNSIHGELLLQGKKTANCSDCHGSHNIFKKHDERSQVYSKNMVNACVQCHEDKWESYNWGIHGKVTALGSDRPPTCAVCHTSHSIWGPNDSRSTISKANTPETCAKCHIKAQPNMAEGIEHYTLTSEGKNAPMYYTYKFFTWLLILTVSFVLIYILLELYRRIKETKK